MFTQTFSPPASSSPGSSHAPGVTRRNSRLRGLSFLRNYTGTHLLSRDPNHYPPSSRANGSPVRPRSASFSNSIPTANNSSAPASGSPADNNHHPTSSSSSNEPAPPAPVRSRSTRLPRSNRLSAIGIPGFSTSSSQAPAGPTAHDSNTQSSTAAPATSNSETPASRRGLTRNRSVRSNRLSAITIPGFSSFSSSPSASSNNNRSDSPPPAQATVDLPHPAVPESDVIDTAAASTTPTTAAVDARTTPSPRPASNTTDTEDPAMLRGRDNANANAMPSETLPSIRFSAYYDQRAARPSLTFQPVSRTLPSGSEVIKVGRYSERDAQPQVSSNLPSAAPVGFKSKVVSRRHCEFWFEDGKWHIKDVKSSSGTFLNHIRLSPPGTESKPYVVNDGDIIQLGIDFKGGEEMIFRCVKMRLELNRGWQNKLNTFNMSTHKRLRSLVANGSNGSTQDCSICLNSVASLFVAPCSHTWHFKCIRSLLNSPQYPIFVCPNCRAAADLEAEVDEPCEDWQQMTSEESEANSEVNNETPPSVACPSGVQEHTPESDPGDVADMTMRVEMGTPSPPNASLSVPERIQSTMSNPVPIPPVVSPAAHSGCAPQPSPGVGSSENPITPRNNAGPWVFDGSAGAGGANGLPVTPGLPVEMRSIDSAALDTARP